jgi:hypothetical protein
LCFVQSGGCLTAIIDRKLSVSLCVFVPLHHILNVEAESFSQAARLLLGFNQQQRYRGGYGKHRQKDRNRFAPGGRKIRWSRAKPARLLPNRKNSRREKLRPTARKIRKKHRIVVEKLVAERIDSRSTRGQHQACAGSSSVCCSRGHIRKKKKNRSVIHGMNNTRQVSK